MLVDLWPLYGLTIRTPRLELRLPVGEELARFADVAGKGIHGPDVRPFLTPWTDGSYEDRARSVLRGHWSGLAGWSIPAWQLGLGVFHDGEPVGMVGLRARDFPVIRQVTTYAWLGIEHQGKGYGTEARIGLLTLAGLAVPFADAAVTEVFQDNHASQGVSRRLGYEHDGISVDARDGEALVSDRLRLTRAAWTGQQRPAVTVDGIAACRAMFGI